MKKIAVILIATIFTNLVNAQSDSVIKSGWGNLDYTVPESPAFKILGNSPDNILKPTSVRNVALSIGNYFLTTGSVIPKNFAVEISPLLLNGKASLNDYNKNKFWHRLRFSLGTNIQDNGGYNIAEGLRLTLIDKTDLRDFKSNPDFTNFLYASAVNTSIAIDKALADHIIKHPEENLTVITAGEKYQNDTSFKKVIKEEAKKFYTDKNVNVDAVSVYRDSIRNLLWNAPIWELGIATLQTSTDSLVKNLKFSQIGFWTTAGFPVGQKSQLLIGGKLGFIDSTDWQTNASAGLRFYYGSNNVKGFLQGEYDYKDKKNSATASLGCQFNITNGLWGQFSIDLVIDEKGKVSYQPGFNIGLGTPEKKKS